MCDCVCVCWARAGVVVHEATSKVCASVRECVLLRVCMCGCVCAFVRERECIDMHIPLLTHTLTRAYTHTHIHAYTGGREENGSQNPPKSSTLRILQQKRQVRMCERLLGCCVCVCVCVCVESVCV
jgi:hypothetical protein